MGEYRRFNEQTLGKCADAQLRLIKYVVDLPPAPTTVGDDVICVIYKTLAADVLFLYWKA